MVRESLTSSARGHAIAMPRWSDEETDNPLRADDRNFYKVEKWTKDGTKIERLLYAGNNLNKARKLFAEAIKHRPRIRLTIRLRTRVLQKWPVVRSDRPDTMPQWFMSCALTGARRHPLISATQPPYRVERRYIPDLMRRASPSNNARHNARNLCACHFERPLAYHQYPRLRPKYPPPPNSSTSTMIIRINSIAVSSFGTFTVPMLIRMRV